ncbi:MAG: aldehyde dehydrogenase family protein, partial [Oscillospiraceae bacterium]
MTREEITSLVEKQRCYYKSGATLPVERRVEALKKLRQALVSQEEAIANAIRQDLGKAREESYMCET